MVALMVVVGAFLTTFVSVIAISSCFASDGCSNPGAEGPVKAEREMMQTAMNVLMVDNDLTRVRASTSGYGGEKIDATSTQFHDTINLRNYMNQAATQFCYRWDADGQIAFQYEVNTEGNCAIDAEQLFP